MIVKHSTDETPKPTPVSLRLARVVSIGNGTVDVCPIGSSVVLHDIPVTFAGNIQEGDVINIQMIDNRRFAFATQSASYADTEVTKSVTIQNGDVIIGGTGGGSSTVLPHLISDLSVHTGTIAQSQAPWAVPQSTIVSAGSGLTGGGTLAGNLSFAVATATGTGLVISSNVLRLSDAIAGNGLSYSSGVISVKLRTESPTGNTSGLQFDGTTGGVFVGAGDGIAVTSQSVRINLYSSGGGNASGMQFDGGALKVGAGNGIAVGSNVVAVNQAYSFVWSAQHLFNSGFNAAASTFTGLLTGTSGTFSDGLNVGTATGAATGEVRANTLSLAGATQGTQGQIRTSAAYANSDFRGLAITNTGNAGLTLQTASISLLGVNESARLVGGNQNSGDGAPGFFAVWTRANSTTIEERLRVNSVGNVGIGIAAPVATASRFVHLSGTTSELHLTSDSSGHNQNDGLSIQMWSDNTAYFVQRENAAMEFWTNNIRRAVIDSAGRLGIGNFSPSHSLDVSGEMRASSSANPRIILESTGSASSSRSFLRFSGTVANEFISIGYYPDASPRRMHINYNSESASLPIMSLTSANRVGINMQTPSYTLDVSGDVRASGAVNVGTAAGTTDGYLYTSGRIGVGKNAADYPLDVVGDIYSSASVRANTSVITQELTGAGASTSVSLTNGTGFRSSQYLSGFAGNGWRIYRQDNSTKAEWEVDNLTVRGTLSVYELLIQQIRATNGSIFVSAAAKIESVTGTGPYTLTVEGGSSDYAPFAVGDVIRAQRVSLGTSTLVWQSDLTVTAINVGSNPRAFTATLRSGSTVPAAGMEYVRLGNTTDTSRQGAVYLTADDSGAPFIDIVDGITSHADWGTPSKIKSRIGRLNGILGGPTANYGIWSGTGTSNADSWVKMAEDGILLNNVPLRMYSGGNQTVDFAASGNLKIGTNVANASTTALNWDGATLSIKGNITVTGGDAETTSGAQSKANAARDTAQTYSDTELGKIVGKTNGKLAFAVAAAPTAGSGLYLGSTYLGYYSGGWKTYMNSTGQFYLSGLGNNGLSWDGSALAIDGDLTARSGYFAGPVTLSEAGGIWQGAGAFANPSNGMKIWADTVSEVFQINLSGATSGTFTITVGANTTSPALNWNASAATVQSAVTNLASVGAGNATVTLSSGVYLITFIGARIGQDLAVSANLTGIVGGTKTATTIRHGSLAGKIAAFDASDERVVFGNLKGAYDYSEDNFGLAAGRYATSWIGIDAINGIRVMNSTTERFRVTTGGVVTVGNSSAAAEPYISIDATNGFRVMQSTTEKFRIATSGTLLIGDQNGSDPFISMDSTNGIRIRDGGVTEFQVDLNGNVIVGPATANNVQITSSALNIRRGSANMLSLDSTSMTINNSAGSAVITMNNSGGASFSNTITVGNRIGIVPGVGTDPYIAIGGTTYPTGFLAANTTGIWMGSESNSPKMRIGTTNASGVLTSGMQWDGSSLTVNGAITAQSGSIEGILSIGSSGGVYQGNGTFASPGTGLKIFSSGVNHVSSITVTATGGTFTITVVRTDTGASATTGSLAYNIAATGTTSMQASLQALSSVGSGNATVTKTGNVYTITFAGARASTKMTVTVATGSLTGGTATVATVTDGGVIGRIAGYSLGTEQWSTDTDGKFYAAGGLVIIDQNSISITPSTSSVWSGIPDSRRSIQWQIPGYQSGVMLTGTVNAVTPYLGEFSINIGNGPDSWTPYITCGGSYISPYDIRLYGDVDISQGSLRILTGLNVGSATGAAAGQIKASAGIIATTAAFSSTLAVTGASTLTGALSVDGELGHSTSSTWINTGISFVANWSNFAADETTWSFARYKRIGDLVFLRGMIKRASGTGLSTSPFTLPANFRPAKRQVFVVMGLRNGQSAATIRTDVLATGVVQFSDIDTTSAYDYISLNGIVFSVA